MQYLGMSVYAALRQMILAGELDGSARTSEAAIAQRLSVSRTPVREALLRLDGEGLVFAQGRGIRVRYLTTNELSQVYETRSVLEGLAARTVAQQQSDGLLRPADVAGLKELATETSKATRSVSLDQAVELNRQFHRRITELAGNAATLRILDSLWDQIVVSTRGGLDSQPRVDQVDHEHDELVVRIEAGRPDDAARMAIDHVLHTRQVIST